MERSSTHLDDTGRNGASGADSPPPHTPDAAFGPAALSMIASVSLFTISHGFVRAIGADIHPFQIAFTTSLFSFTFYLPWLLRTRFRPLRTTRMSLHWIRGVFNATAVASWYVALTLTPLADAVALSLTGPLVVTLGAILFLGESARLRRWVALTVGFAGALLIVRPGFQAVTLGYVFVVLSLVATAGSRLLTKQLTRTDAPATIGAWMALAQIPITLAAAIFVWVWPSPLQLLIMVIVGLLVGAAHFTLSIAYKRGDVGSLEPFNFIRLVIAALIGTVFFAERPDLWTWIGGAVIVAATTYVAHREAIRRQQESAR